MRAATILKKLDAMYAELEAIQEADGTGLLPEDWVGLSDALLGLTTDLASAREDLKASIEAFRYEQKFGGDL